MSVAKGQTLRLRPARVGRWVWRRTRGALRVMVVPEPVRSRVFDACVALFVCVFDVWQLVDPPAGGTIDRLAGAAFLAAAAVPLLWRRRHAIAVLAALTLVNLAWFAIPSVTTPPLEHFNAGFVAFIVSLYSTGLYAGSPTTAVVAAVAVLAAILPTAALADEEFQSNPRVFFLNAAIIAIFFYVGLIGRVQRDYLQERAARVEQERAEQARRVAATERARIARELHDVVAHSVGLMTVQAGAAHMIADKDPGAAVTSLSAIERTGRQALAELRRLLGILRTDGDEDRGLSPQPGLDRVDELVAEVRHAGVDVRITAEGDLGALPTALNMSGFRIVQEALTNVVKHAGRPVRADVTIRCDRDRLVLEVADDGPGAAASSASVPGGNGLIGIRERVALFGGRLMTGPRRDGGFAVRAEIPLEHAQR
jgi:signal transduction histidine kinase